MKADKRRKTTDILSTNDYMLDYFINEEKLKHQLDDGGNIDRTLGNDLVDKINMIKPELDSRVKSDNITTPSSPAMLPSNSTSVDFNEDSFDEQNVRTGFKSAAGKSAYRSAKSERRSKAPPSVARRYAPPQQPQQPIPTQVPKEEEAAVPEETREEKMARARECYYLLDELREKHGIRLTKDFSIYDDPDDMESELKYHTDKRKKANKVDFYKKVLLGIISGTEFLNEKYDPFRFKLKDWSKQVATDMDDYTEILEEIYEKYKSTGGGMAPEFRLILMIVMSGVTYHISQTLFGADGLGNVMKNNPNVLQSIMKSMGNVNVDKNIHPNNTNILAELRKNRTNNDAKSESNTDMVELERQKYESQRKLFEEKLKLQNLAHQRQMEELIQKMENSRSNIGTETPVSKIYRNRSDSEDSGQNSASYNQVLSDASRQPRFMSTKKKMSSESSIDNTISDSSGKSKSSSNKSASVKNAKLSDKHILDGIMDSLESLDSSVISSSHKKSSRGVNSSSYQRSARPPRSSRLSTARKKTNVIDL